MPSMFVLLFCAFSLLVPGLSVNCAQPCFAAPRVQEEAQAVQNTLLLSNKSHHDLVAIRLSDGTTTSFARMDLGPGSEDELENPGGTVEVRLDLGLSLCTWKDINLSHVQSLTLCPEHETCLIVQRDKGQPLHVRGTRESLLPAADARPVCSLEGFHTGMTMKDACGLIKTYYTMEEDVYLATLGFANQVWSARLYANTDNARELGDAQLENVELRQTLSLPNLKGVLQALARQNYVPWQATFPGIEMTFSEMLNYPPAVHSELIRVCTEAFLKQGRGIASIMFAPKDLVQELATSPEFPQRDTQLYTISLHRDSDTLILDMTAYSVEDLQR